MIVTRNWMIVTVVTIVKLNDSNCYNETWMIVTVQISN